MMAVESDFKFLLSDDSGASEIWQMLMPWLILPPRLEMHSKGGFVPQE